LMMVVEKLWLTKVLIKRHFGFYSKAPLK